MPANLTPEYHRADERYKAATTVEEKIEALEEMLRVMPKHKGTDGLQGDIKARIAKLRRQPANKAARATHSHMVPREGAGQIALVGPPNSGKSSIVAAFTHARPEVAPYPFSTREPVPGMMRFEDIAFQLVDLPPLNDEHVEPWVFDIVRGADFAWIVVPVENGLDGVETTLRILAAKAIDLMPAGAGAPRAVGGRTLRPALVVATGIDREGGEEDLAIVDELLERRWPLVGASSATGTGADLLGRKTFEALRLVRVYTKQPGKAADRSSPFTLTAGATVGELAARIHKDIAASMKFARVWGPSAFEGQSVHADHVLAEGDVVEIHV